MADSQLTSIDVRADRRELRRRARVLGFVSLSSPLAMNMYVPAFPQMAASLRTDVASIQLTITSYLIALAVGQNVYGPLSDKFGRKGPLYAGLGLFVVASAALAMSRTLPWMIGWRFVQGLGACAALAIPRAMMRDQHSGADAARMLAGILLVSSIAPILAPLAGSLITAFVGWPLIFWSIAATGLAAIVLVRAGVPETLPPERRAESVGFVRAYGRLLRDPTFLAAAMMMAMGQAVFLSYLAASPSIFITLYGLESWEFSLIFAAGAVTWAGSAQLTPQLVERRGAPHVAAASIRIAFLFTAILLGGALAGLESLWFLTGSVLLIFGALGVMLPAATVAALHPHGEIAGSASALIGTFGFGVGAVMTALVSIIADGTEIPMLAVMAACALLAELLAWIAFRRPAAVQV